MEPIRLYLGICRHVLKSFYIKKKKKNKNGVVDLQLPCNQPQKLEAYPKRTHCILMLTLQIVLHPLVAFLLSPRFL